MELFKWRLKKFFNLRCELGRRRRCCGAVNNLASSVDDKLCEVPLDVVAERSFALGCCFHPSPQRMRVFAVDFDFLEKLALEVVFFHKLGDLLVAGWLLLAELVAREGKDAKSFFLVGIRLVKGLKCFVFRVGNASFRRDIDHHKRVTRVAGEADLLSIVQSRLEIVQRRHTSGKKNCLPR